tara:strand:+ start:360 stop:887 length:528 start_codon:yes stop_codon:yes gene_type:complete
MALWGNDDNITTFGTVSLSGNTVTGTGTTFTTDVEVGQVIRFGVRGGVGTYYGDAVITSVASTVSLTIGSTAGLSPDLFGAGSTSYYISELPKYTVLDSKYSENSYGTEDSLVYGVATADHEPGLSTNDPYDLAHAGWVGVTTYVDMHGNLRVKSEVLVAMSGIQTGNLPYPTNA